MYIRLLCHCMIAWAGEMASCLHALKLIMYGRYINIFSSPSSVVTGVMHTCKGVTIAIVH